MTQECENIDNIKCKNCFFGRTHLYTDRSQRPNMWNENFTVSFPTSWYSFKTIIVLARCTLTPTVYSETLAKQRLNLLLKNLQDPLIILVTCTMTSAMDRVISVYAPCAAKVGYDTGLWQQGLHVAFTYGMVEKARQILIINDSVLGPLYPLFSSQHVRSGIVAAAVWEHHVISAAAVMYGTNIIHSDKFKQYWMMTRFFCGKWGSMKLYEGGFLQQYKSDCVTWTRDIGEFSTPINGLYCLPFYKHKNTHNSIKSYYDIHQKMPLFNMTKIATLIKCQ
jgi:hypothetical protein